MWLIGMVVCVLMLAGHAVMNTGHGSHSHEGAAAEEQVATPTAPDGAPAESEPDDVPTEPALENAPQPESGHHH